MTTKELDNFISEYYDEMKEKRGMEEARYAILTAKLASLQFTLIDAGVIEQGVLNQKTKSVLISLRQSLDEQISVPSPFVDKDEE